MNSARRQRKIIPAPIPAGKSRTGLSASAVRLLRALASTGAYAISDPVEDGVVIRAVKDGVSVAGGRFPRTAASELVAGDLAAEERTALGACKLRISQTGVAHMRRGAAANDETFRAQHDDIVTAQVTVDERPTKVRLDATESPLAWLRRRTGRNGEPLVDAAGFEAGERLRRDLTSACMLPSVTVNWTSPAVDSGRGVRDPAHASDRAIAARQRVTRALDAVGPEFGGLLVDLCGFLKGLERIERERGWPPRSGKVVANLALGRLADHYGLAPQAVGPERSSRVRSWRALLEDALAE